MGKVIRGSTNENKCHFTTSKMALVCLSTIFQPTRRRVEMAVPGLEVGTHEITTGRHGSANNIHSFSWRHTVFGLHSSGESTASSEPDAYKTPRI
jgi:hypothetical protein